MSYDSKKDTKKHIARVRQLLAEFSEELYEQGKVHDKSKLKEPEKSCFDIYTPKLKGTTYGSEEYQESLKQMQPALDHHYQNNMHHPEAYLNNDVGNMTLMSLVEMFFDWVAASERHADGDIFKSIEINSKRFDLPDKMKRIFINTAMRWL